MPSHIVSFKHLELFHLNEQQSKWFANP